MQAYSELWLTIVKSTQHPFRSTRLDLFCLQSVFENIAPSAWPEWARAGAKSEGWDAEGGKARTKVGMISDLF